MKYHIALSPPCDLEGMTRNAQLGMTPSHAIWELSQRLGAKVHQPGEEQILPIDRILAKVIGRPEHWALARNLSLQCDEDDIIYCTGEDVGIPLATLCGLKKRRPKLIGYFHNMNRPRGRLALQIFQVANKIDLFVSTVPSEITFLSQYLQLPKNRIYEVKAQPTDASFFTPGPTSHEKRRPIIGSGGLEKRDYRTLADATKDLDVDVKICAFSNNAKKLKRSFPKLIPNNMSSRFYSWYELLQLYRDSDIVVVPLVENTQEAGLSTLFEAMACCKPVVITRTPGIISKLIDEGIVTGVSPYDSEQMKQAIQNLLDNPYKAQMQAQRGYELVQKQYNQKNYVEYLAMEISSRFESPVRTAIFV
ncbi:MULTISPECIES: glycosyltransferase family 4 protein [Nostocales]|uniref:Glycosyltransferase family 4 protein n=3 Tax=Nostocales TaxID=1161 RepID=A0A0C1RDP9_9CYAN|nr:glycosyltransferase family 4 protein [Tolypothrix bouteillei]KAF3886337.1 glycosyltransferase family 4 protein [Tolypothrix bouteillei VB521301]